MNLPIKIASRSSQLALVQIDEVIANLKAQGTSFDYQIIKLETNGDKDKTTPLTQSRDNFFTDSIDRAILDAQADIGIHSAKDLPQQMPEGLKIFALTKGLDDRDAWVAQVHFKDLPKGAKVGTSSALRQQQILALRPDIAIVNIRGTIQERLQLVKEAKLDGVVVALCALQRLKLDSEVKDIFPWEGMPLQGQLAVVGQADNHELAKLFAGIDVRRQYGKVTLVGAGPGDPELITLKGLKALEHADTIFYDYLLDPTLLKHAPQAKHIYVGKRKDAHSLSQEELSKLLRKEAMAGKRIVRLKGGDPLIFGRGADEIEHLRSFHIDVDVIPGITSATGIPSSLGIPLTARGISSSVAFLSGHEEDEDKEHPKPINIPAAETLVFLMGLTKLKIIIASLKKAGWKDETPVMVISNGTKPQEELVNGTLSNIEALVAAAKLTPPALIVVGKTVELYREPQKKTLLHCGMHPELYKNLGKIISWPMIDIKPAVLNEAQQKDLLQAFETTDIVIATSWFAAEYFYNVIASEAKQSLKIGTSTFLKKVDVPIFAVIGQRTKKALQMHGIEPALVSFDETAEGLFKAMSAHFDLKGKKILFPRSSLPNPYLKEALAKQGAIVTEVTIYENTKPAKRPLPQVSIDGVIFTSPSTVRNFLQDYGTIPASWAIMAKGPVTLKTLQEAGYTHAASLS